MGLPPSDQSEWLWQSPCSRSRRAAAASLSGDTSTDSSVARYAGVDPPSASVITWAVVFPTPGIFWSRAGVMPVSSASGRPAMAAAALRNARTL